MYSLLLLVKTLNLIPKFHLMKVKQLLLKLDLCRSFHLESSAELSEVVVSRHCQESVTNEYSWNLATMGQAPFISGYYCLAHLS